MMLSLLAGLLAGIVSNNSLWSIIPVNATTPLWDITVGHDRAVWATSSQPPGLFRVDGSGNVTFQALSQFHPTALAPGAGSRLWVDSVYSMPAMLSYDTKTQAITTFSVVSPTRDYPETADMIPGDNGSVWYSEYTHVANMSRTGVITEYPYRQLIFGGGELGKTPDGRIWFGEAQIYPPRIGWIRPRTHEFKDFTLPSDVIENSHLSFATAPDGSVWLTVWGFKLTFIHVDPHTMTMTESPGFDTFAWTNAVPENGLVYFAPGWPPNALGVFDAAKNDVTFYYAPNNDGTDRVIIGPDGNLWTAMGPIPAIGIFSVRSPMAARKEGS